MNPKTVGKANTSDILQTYPLTQGQAALWFHYTSAPQSVAYNLAGAIAVPGDTDLDALRRAFQRVADRHPMLRTRFASEHGEPIQYVAPSVQVAFQVEDASDWDRSQLNTRLAQEIYQPFDLQQGPVWRVMVLQWAPLSDAADAGGPRQEHLVLLIVHHIIIDLWSGAIILSEVAALYHEETTGVPAQLRSPRTTYAEWVHQEQAWLACAEAAASWDYWRRVLSGELPTLNLPTDRPRPPVATGRGAVHAMQLDAELVAGLRALAEREGTPLHVLLLAVFQVLLHRYTGQGDILIGFPKAGRRASTARLVGYFVNQTVVRADLGQDPSFRDLLSRTATFMEESAAHDRYPFSLLVQRLQPDRDLRRSPLIQAVFSWQQAPRLLPRASAGPFVLGQTGQETVELGRLSVRAVHLPYRVAPFDIMMFATGAPEGIAVAIEYAVDLFDATTIARMAENYRTLLESIVATPAATVSALTILPERERAQLVEGWNAAAAPYPAQACLHRLFEQQVANTPDGLAVVDERAHLTYHQLNQRANQLAHLLLESGVGPNSLIGIYMSPSVEMVVAILGVLKAGGAYLPLDPANPSERLSFMITDARPTLLLSTEPLRAELPDIAVPLFLIDADEGKLCAYSQADPSTTDDPDHLAYVIYTSGSTGRPKGVALAHRGVVNLLIDLQRRQAIGTGDPCSWWTSPSFDVSVYEIFSPLVAGGSVHVIPQHLRLDGPALLDWLCTHRIRSAYLPPFFLKDFADWLDDHPGASPLRRLLVGVEPIPANLLAHIRAQLPELAVINGYGPTETTICSTLYSVGSRETGSGNTPIGRPVINTQVYLLDPTLKPVPIGVVGELYIGGVGLAHGYLRRPELTAERFIASPFQAGQRLYRTGDLARYRADGNLVFVGRADTQVKLHGVRIELGEIEAHLVQHPDVSQAVVLLREQPAGGQHLIAYVTASGSPPLFPDDLRLFLEQRLPSAMVPTAFTVMDTFPLTVTGKINRRALPIPESLQVKVEAASRKPRTDVETTLTEIWQQLLGEGRIGVDDNFFELGGDSIMSLQIVARAAEAGIRLRPRDVFREPTVAGLAALADRVEPVEMSPAQEVVEGPVPLTPIQHWFFEQRFPNPHQWNQSLLLRTPRPLDSRHLRAAVLALLMQHDALRLRYDKGTEGWRQTYGPTAAEAGFAVIDLSALPIAQQMEALRTHTAEQQRRLDLSTGPLIRVLHFVMGPYTTGRLLIVAHHLIVDALSWGILLADLQHAYRQQEKGQPIRLPPKTTPFHVWTRRLTDFAGSADLDRYIAFWEHATADRPPALPGDPLRSVETAAKPNREGDARSFSVSLSRDETRALLKDVSDAYGTDVEDLLLTALARTLRSWRGTGTLWIDLEAHGRENLFQDVDLSRTVGWFTALYPLRLDLPDETGLAASIKAIKEQRRRVPHHGLGYGLLRYLGPDLNLRERLEARGTAPLSFNYMGRLPHIDGDLLIAERTLAPADGWRDPDAPRAHMIEVDAAVLDGVLRATWRYNPRLHAQHTIGCIADRFIAEMRRLIAHCRAPEAIGYTPSDFPDADLNQAELDAMLQGARPLKTGGSRRNITAIYPLSPMQQGMVFHTLYAPDSAIYFEQIAFTVRGSFNVSAFEPAWQEVFNRHTSLRTSFAWQDLDRVLQVVHKDVVAPFERHDWRDVSPTDLHTRFEDLLAEERRRGFDLSVPSLVRLIVIQTADDCYRILFNQHHALLDGWSVALLLNELFTCYAAIINDQDSGLPPAHPYQEYITWLQAQDLAAAEAFWRAELTNAVPMGRRSTRPPTGAAQPAAQDVAVPADLTTALQALAREQRLTLSTLMQGAWALLLSHQSDRDDVIFGVTLSGRPPELPGSMTMVGLLINTLPLRVQLSPEMSLFNWLHQIQDKALALQQFDYSPLSRVQSWGGVRPGGALFDTLVVVENYPVQPPAVDVLHDLQIADIRAVEQTTYALTLAVTEGPQLHLRMLYDPARFEDNTIRRLLNALHSALECMAADPGTSLAGWRSAVEAADDQGLAIEVGNVAIDLPQVQLPAVFPQQRERKAETENVSHNAQGHPITPLEGYLIRQWQRVLKVEEVSVNDNFFYLGGDSLTGAICTYQIQNAMQEQIPLNAIFEAPTIVAFAGYLERSHPAGVARLLGSSAPTAVSPPRVATPATLVPIQPKGNKPPLFCVHPAGGIVFPYYALAAHLGPTQPLYGLQDPSLYQDNSDPESIEALAARYLALVRTVQPEGPIHLLGWSVGGLIAYEMALQSRRQGRPVDALYILDTQAPSGADSGRVSRSALPRSALEVRKLWRHISDVKSAVGPVVSYVRSGLFLLASSAASEKRVPFDGKPTLRDIVGWAVLDTWRARLLKDQPEIAGTVSQEASLQLVGMPVVRRILELVRAHTRLAQRYVARRYPGRVTLFRAVGSGASGKRTADPTLGWDALAEYGVEVHTIKANHVALFVKPHVEILARQLNACLEEEQ